MSSIPSSETETEGPILNQENKTDIGEQRVNSEVNLHAEIEPVESDF